MKKSILFKSLILASLCFSLIFACADENDPSTPIDYSVAEAKLHQDYANNAITALSWSTQRGYQVANFTASTKSRNQSNSITAWYTVSNATATREMDLKNLGTNVPDAIKGAFEATDYDNATLWTIEEIELEHNYNNNGTISESYYEMELQNIPNPKLEAELFFNYEEGQDSSLLFSKEELDDDNDNDDDKFVINAQLTAAVELAVPGAQIIDAEVDDNIIEVEAIATIDGIKKEIELEFSMNYDLLSKVTETEYTYNTMPSEFDVVKDWFADIAQNTTSVPAPTTNPKVTIEEGAQSEDNINYYYEVEIDDYVVGNTEYELEFYLSDDHKIIDVSLD